MADYLNTDYSSDYSFEESAFTVLSGVSIVTPIENRSLEDPQFGDETINVILGFQPIRSYRPNRSFNTLENLEVGKGVLIDAKKSFEY